MIVTENVLSVFSFINGTWQIQLAMFAMGLYVIVVYGNYQSEDPRIDHVCQMAITHCTTCHAILAISMFIISLKSFDRPLLRNLIGFLGTMMMLLSQITSMNCFYLQPKITRLQGISDRAIFLYSSVESLFPSTLIFGYMMFLLFRTFTRTKIQTDKKLCKPTWITHVDTLPAL